MLPVNVMAAKKMLVLCGPTYPKRLWCAWELFTLFSFSNRQQALDRVELIPLDARGHSPPTASRTLSHTRTASEDDGETHAAPLEAHGDDGTSPSGDLSVRSMQSTGSLAPHSTGSLGRLGAGGSERSWATDHEADLVLALLENFSVAASGCVSWRGRGGGGGRGRRFGGVFKQGAAVCAARDLTPPPNPPPLSPAASLTPMKSTGFDR